MKNYRIWLRLSITCLLIVCCCSSSVLANQEDEERDIREFIQKLYETRAQHLINGNEQLLSGFYLDAKDASQYAKKMEIKRSTYLLTWAKVRKLQFVSAEPFIRIVRIKKEDNIVRVSLVQSLKLSYRYNDSLLPPQHFGIGTRHSLKLVKNGDRWLVSNEWYLDPLDENPALIPSQSAAHKKQHITENLYPEVPIIGGEKSKRRFKREQAIAYADKYAGIAWGAGNGNRYNRQYRDYTGIGGDCTNFVSQVIGDPKEGGGLPMIHGWRYFKNTGGSVSWVQTDSFKHFILNSGYGQLVARGTYTEVMNPNKKFPQGAFRDMLPGDLIAYELEGDVDHFAVFIGLDDNGYPLVNCHTADRYHTPFDLGWDKTTRYWLIHIKD